MTIRIDALEQYLAADNDDPASPTRDGQSLRVIALALVGLLTDTRAEIVRRRTASLGRTDGGIAAWGRTEPVRTEHGPDVCGYDVDALADLVRTFERERMARPAAHLRVWFHDQGLDPDELGGQPDREAAAQAEWGAP